MKSMKLISVALTSILLGLGSVNAQQRTVTDHIGRVVSIPDQPKRVVSLIEPLITVPLMEMGVNVIASQARTDDGGTLLANDFLKETLGIKAKDIGLAGTGAIGQLDIEKLRELKPDLIIGTEADAAQVDVLSNIAPVFLQRSRTNEVYGYLPQRDLSQIVGKEEEFAKLEQAYLKRVEAIKSSLAEADKQKTFVAFIVLDQLNIISNMTGAVQAMKDLGFHKLDIQGHGERTGKGRGFVVPFSSEEFPRLNPDLLIIMNSIVRPDQGEEAVRKRLDEISPGWDRFLKPAKENRVLYLDAAKVVTPSIASANHALDAFEAWLERSK